MKKILIVSMLFSFAVTSMLAKGETVVEPKKFTCSQDAYLFNGSSPTNTYSINLSNGDYLPQKKIPSRFINGTGYNVKDSMIWGYDIKNKKVIRVDAEFNTKAYTVAKLPDGKYYAGDVSLDGFLYLKKHDDNNLYKIDLNSGEPKFVKKIALFNNQMFNGIWKKNTTVNFGDFAFNPKDKMLYSISETDDETYNHLYRIHPDSGLIEDLGEANKGVEVDYHTFVFDVDGNLYFYGKSGIIYKIEISKEKYIAKPFKETDNKLGGGDGARCPNAKVEQPEPKEEILPQECTNAPSDLVAFNSDFDFDRNSDVDGDGSKGTIARYKNIATVNGEDIDVVVSVENLKGISTLEKTGTTPKGFKFQKIEGEDPSIGFFIGSKREDEKGTEYEATLKFKFVEHGTNTPISFNFETQVYDIDNFYNRTEKIIINNKYYKFFQTSEDTHIKGTRTGDIDTFENFENEDSENFNQNATVKFIHESKSSFVMKFSATKNKKSGEGIGKAGFNLVFGTTELGLPPCKVSAEPIADYHFDECLWDGTENEVKDSSSNHIDAVGKNGITTQNRGAIKRSGLFSDSKYVDAGDNFNDIFGNSNDKFTITAWIKPAVLSDKKTNHETKNTFIAKASDAKNDNLEIGVNSDGSLHVYLDTKHKDKYANIGTGITPDKWHFVAISYNGNSINVTIDENHYVDNTTWSGGGNIDNAKGSPLTIGASLHVDNYFHGGIDEVKIFDKAFDDAEIENIYNREKDNDGSLREDKVCPAQLMAEYRFDSCEYYGIENEVIDSVGLNHGKSINTRSTFDGKIQRAVIFNDSQIIAEPNFAFASEPFALSFWINPSTFPESDYMAVLSKEVEIYLKKDGKLSVNLKNESDNLVSSDKLNLDEWTHVALSSDGKQIKLYVNGSEKGSVDANDTGKDGSNSLMIGKTSWDEAEPFAGRIDELKIFDDALSKEKLDEIIADTGNDREETICLAPIGCKSEAVIIDDTKYVHEIDLATGDKITYTMTDEQIGGASINGFGYNVKDGYFWGSNQGKGGYLVRVGKDEDDIYSQEKIGPIVGLPTNKGTFIGDIDENGHLYLYYKNTPQKGTHTMFIVNLDKNSTDYEYAKVIDSFELENINIADMAFNPVDNQLYAIESDNDFYKIDIQKREVIPLKDDVIDLKNDTYGTSFFDSSGFFYAIKNSSRDVIRVMFREDENGTYVKASTFSSLINENVKKVNIDGGRCNLYPILIDYGDAPDSYKTSLDEDGARHKISVDEPLVFFGDGVDNEPDAWILDRDNDDGLVGKLKLLYTSTEKYSVKLKVKNETDKIAKVVGWIDFNGNGKFEKKEGVTSIVNAKTEKNVELSWKVPNDIKEGETYARFRVTTESLTTDDQDAYGVRKDGEVEDYKITIKEGNIFDAWGFPEGSKDNPVIHTKVVNESISLYTTSLNRARTEEIPYVFKDIKIGLFDKSGMMISSYQDVNTTGPHSIVYFNDIATAHRYLYVKFKYKDDDNITHECNATDPFAIRPKSFDISAKKDTNDTFFRAGKDINVTIKVDDINGNFINSFDLNSSVYQVDYNETKEPVCVRGDFDFNKTNLINGVAKFQATYSEVGELNFGVKEVNGSEFAIIDKDDGSGINRFIEEDKASELFHPADVLSFFKYKAINNKPYTYYSNNPREMGIEFDVNITVVNKKNQTLQNYTDRCYRDDVNIRVNYNRTGNLDNPIFVNSNDGSDAGVDFQVGAFKYVVDESTFNKGKSHREINMNFPRFVKTPKEPLKFEITDTNSSIEPSKVSKIVNINKTISFIYARAHAPNEQTVVGDTINAVVDYEVYLPLGINGSDFGLPNGLVDSEDDMYWYKLPIDSVFGYKIGTAPRLRFSMGATINAFTPILITINANKTPYTNRVIYTPKNFLLYNRFNSSATKHSFRVNFSSENSSWAGKGKAGVIVDEQVSNRGLRKMDW